MSEPEERTPSKVVTPRAVAVGLALAVVVNVASVASNYLLGFVHLTYAHIDLALLIPFFLGVLGPNMLIRAYRPSWGLRYRELLFVFCLAWIGFMVPTWGMSNYVMTMMASAEYYASPENQWRELFFAYLPEWIIVTNEFDANRDYYAGISDHMPVPWSSWVVPVFWWMSFFGGLLAVGICLVVMLRKQWVEHERLAYPLVNTPVVLMETSDEREAVIPKVMRNRLFITGAVVTFSMMLWNVSAYWTQWSSFPIDAAFNTNINIGRSFPPHPIRMNVITIVFAYFMNMDVLFSIWFFQIVNTLQQGILARIGVIADSGTAVPGGLVAVQFIGGMVAYALWGFWVARGHFRMVWRHVTGHPTDLRDRDEFLSYRTALVTGACGLAYVVYWLNAVGMSFPVIAVFLALLFLFYAALCRAVAESGLVMVDLPINAHQFTVGMLGSASLSPQNLTALGLGSGFARNWKTFPMIIPSHVARLRSILGIDGRVLFFWCVVTFVLSAAAAISFSIYSGYRLGGAANYHNNISGDPGFYNLIVTWINNSTTISGGEVTFLLTGFFIVTGMTIARYYLSWWPLSPIGFVVAAGGPVRNSFFPVLLVWILKSILIRTGGVRLYQAVQPLMIGILVGYVLGAAIAVGADWLYFPGSIHEIQFF